MADGQRLWRRAGRTHPTLERKEEVSIQDGTDSTPPHLQALYEELSVKIEEYFRAWWAERDVEEQGDYVNCWALVANFGNLNAPAPNGYIVETGPTNMPPHGIKGLLAEGVDWVVEMQDLESD